MLNLLRHISCFMSSLEKPYVVDNSGLTGGGQRLSSTFPRRAVLTEPRHPAHPVWVPRSSFGPHCNASHCPSCSVDPKLPWNVG